MEKGMIIDSFMAFALKCLKLLPKGQMGSYKAAKWLAKKGVTYHGQRVDKKRGI